MEDKERQLEKLAGEVLRNYHIDIDMTHVGSTYFVLRPSGVEPRGVLHLYLKDGMRHNIPLTPQQEVKLHLLWLQDEGYMSGLGIDLDPDAIRDIGEMDKYDEYDE